jgi:hypothetical protein
MGTDIHGYLHTRHRQIPIPTGRNYKLFAALADVRNGYGFAGVTTHDVIRPISEPRGLPEGITDRINRLEAEMSAAGISYSGILADVVFDATDYGDHSQSWLTLNEVLEWDGWDQTLHECGIISRDDFETYEPNTVPKGGWYGGIMGRDIIVVDQREGKLPSDWTHIQVYWDSRTLRDVCSSFLTWCMWAKDEYDWDKEHPARLVFGFDS